MRKHFSVFVLLLLVVVVSADAQDITTFTSIGRVTSFTKTTSGVILNCADNSQVRVEVLSPDLIRIRAAFDKSLPNRDHSWAIAKSSWSPISWNVSESPEAITVTTDEIKAVIRRAPLLFEFYDAKSGTLINSDEQPISYDAKGLYKSMMFDADAGTFIAVSKKLGLDEHFYGLGEKASRLDKRRLSFVNWNSDTPGYTEGRDPIYQTVPFYIDLQNGKAYGVFFDNSYRSYFDFGRTSNQRAWFGSEGGEVNYYFFFGSSIKKIVSRYTELTGRMPMPPMWALGNQQSRWSYYPASMVEEISRQYRARDLPLDVIHLDIDYVQAYRVFTWDTARFPNPKELAEKLTQQGIKIITIVDPGVKHQPAPASSGQITSVTPELEPQQHRYYVFDQGLAKNFFQRRRGGELFVSRVWPGDSVFVDYTLADARTWWGD